MALTREQDIACAQLSEILGEYLEMSGGFFWKRKPCFQAVAHRLGLDEFWIGAGMPAMACRALLEATLDRRPKKFAELVEAIVRTGLSRREKLGSPVGVAEMTRISELCLQAGAYVTEIRKPAFLAELVQDQPIAPAAPPPNLVPPSTMAAASSSALTEGLAELRAGLGHGETIEALARWLAELFPTQGIEVRVAFAKAVGHVEGVITLGEEDLPVKGFANMAPLEARDVLLFAEELEGPPRDPAGLIFCFGGLEEGADEKLQRIEQRSAFLLTDGDFDLVFQKRIGLSELLQKKLYGLRAAGRVHMPTAEIVWGS